MDDVVKVITGEIVDKICDCGQPMRWLEKREEKDGPYKCHVCDNPDCGVKTVGGHGGIRRWSWPIEGHAVERSDG